MIFTFSFDLGDKIDEIAHMDRTTVKNVVNEDFTCLVDKWEKKNGLVKKVSKK